MAGSHWRQTLLAWRNRAFPDARTGWMPVFSLAYLGFLFLPLLFGWFDRHGHGLLVTLATLPAFLWLYLRLFRCEGIGMLPPIIGIAMLGYLLLPFNSFANTYLIYVAATAAFVGSLWLGLAVFGLLLAVFVAQAIWLHPMHGQFIAIITAVVGLSAFFSNWQWLQRQRKDVELRLSHDEVRRLAQVAERERIGRDLHDLLGHTLSLIALKSELARKLIDRDPPAARLEVIEVERVARDALAQVRRAVTGIRAAALAPELASARLLLDGDGTELIHHVAELDLPPTSETCLALVLREAATNIHRHARARRVEVSLREEDGQAVLTVVDDGRGGAGALGNGLSGMSERLRALGGELRIVSPPGEGTRLVATLPLPADEGGKVVPLGRAAA